MQVFVLVSVVILSWSHEKGEQLTLHTNCFKSNEIYIACGGKQPGEHFGPPILLKMSRLKIMMLKIHALKYYCSSKWTEIDIASLPCYLA